MGNNFKRVLAIVLAATCMLVFSFSMTFAAESPQKGDVKKGAYNNYYQITKTGKDRTVAIYKTYKKSQKHRTIPAYKTIAGKSYKITAIDKNAYTGCKKLKSLKIKSKYLTKVDKKAFKKGVKVKKLKVYVTKKMSKKNFKKLKKSLIKAGVKAKNIKRAKKW